MLKFNDFILCFNYWWLSTHFSSPDLWIKHNLYFFYMLKKKTQYLYNDKLMPPWITIVCSFRSHTILQELIFDVDSRSNNPCQSSTSGGETIWTIDLDQTFESYSYTKEFNYVTSCVGTKVDNVYYCCIKN